MGEDLMKKLVTLILAAGLVVSSAIPASAIEFKASGEWLMGFGLGDSNLVNKVRESGGSKNKYSNDDKFTAAQRVRLQLDAVASENLSGTVLFELTESMWGNAETNGALGADGNNVGVLNAYIDWAIPDTELKVRMGLAPVELPNVAGGSSVLNTDALASVTVSYQFNENVGATLLWGRPFNDNYSGDGTGNSKTSYLDNVDLIALTIPLTFDGIEITPWVMYGLIGENAGRVEFGEGNSPNDLFSVKSFYTSDDGEPTALDVNRKDQYTNAFWAGIATSITLADPLNIELDLNYGYVGSAGRFTVERSDGVEKRWDTARQGFLAKALIEYKMDWGTPGIFGWYATGDDDDPGNGSERLPAIEAKGNFTSMMGDDNWGWGSNPNWYDMTLNYAGTWGIGIQLKDMTFIENLSHTFRVAYWGGTNSPAMAKYMADGIGFLNSDFSISNGLYLTTNDSLVEFNLITKYEMYENFEVNLELGYMINNFDHDTWKKSHNGRAGDTYEYQDAWKAQLIFAYTF